MNLEILRVNSVGKVRRATLHGRPFLVAPMTLIVPGVLHGNRGPMYYPLEEIEKNPDDWNGMPLVNGHPRKDGEYISARSPEVYDKHSLGFVFNATVDGKLIAEAWFDEEVAGKVDSRIVANLNASRSFELSTGLNTTHDQVKGEFNGRKYDSIARDYHPDHLAVLLDEVGACSINDGCGVLVNSLEVDQFKVGTRAELIEVDGKLVWRVVNDDPLLQVTTMAEWLAHQGERKGYGQVFARMDARDQMELWYVDGDGDEPGFDTIVNDNLRVLPSVASVTYKATSFPPEDKGWKQVYPDNVDVVANYDYNLVSQLRLALTLLGPDEWIEDAKDGFVVFKKAGKTFKQAYTITDGELVVGPAATELITVKPYYRRIPTNPKGDADMAGNVKKLTEAQRKGNVDYITSNCGCWKDGKDTLSKFSDPQLITLYNATKSEKMGRKVNPTLNAEDEIVQGISIGELAEFLSVAADPANDPAGFIKEIKAKLDEIQASLDGSADPAEPTDEPIVDEPVAASVNRGRVQPRNGDQGRKPQTVADWRKFAPREVVEAFDNAATVVNSQKDQLIAKLVANVGDDENRKKTLVTLFRKKDLAELKALASLIPSQTAHNHEVDDSSPSWEGAAGGTSNSGEGVDTLNSADSDSLPLPRMNYQDLAYTANGKAKK